MTALPRRPFLAASLGLLVLVTGLAACTAEKKPEPKAAATPAATQAVGAAPAAAPAGGAATELKWPGRPAKAPILGAIPNAPKRATPAPTPAGQTATPTPTPPTPPAPLKQQIIFYVDTVTSGAAESPFDVDANLSCVRSSVFSRGMHITWRLQAFDNTGTEIQTATADSIVLKLPGGKEAPFRYGRHGDYWFWTATWDVPMDFPLGTVDWSVAAKTKSGLAGTYKEFAVWTQPGAERLLADGTKAVSDSRTTIVN